MVFLGIDPGTAITGYGLIREEGSSLRAVAYGAITTPPDLALPQRLVLLHRALDDLIRRWQALPPARRTHFLRKRVGFRMTAV